MKLSLPYLYERHEHWKGRIAAAGVWDSELFLPVEIKIRKNHRRYNAVFQRKIKIIKGSKQISDSIVIYNKVEDFDETFIDNIIVHEMIHQFIIQNNLKDTSAHGRLFKGLMNRINSLFPAELSIKVRDLNPDMPLKGKGIEAHRLLLIEFNDGKWICAVVMPSKIVFFENLIKKNKKIWGVKSYEWAVSYDVFFSRFTRCSSRLHGVTKTPVEMAMFREEYGIATVEEPIVKPATKQNLFGIFKRK